MTSFHVFGRFGRRGTVFGLGLTLALLLAHGAQAQENKLAAYKAEAKNKPKEFGAAFALGRAYRRAGKWAEAKAELQRASGLATGDEGPKTKYELAQVEFDQGVTNPSLPAPPSLPACKAVKVGKLGEALSRVCAAEAWLTMERVAIAEDELAAAEKIDASLFELKLGQIKVLVAKQSHDDAVAKLKALTASNGARAEGFLWLGRELLEVNKNADAVAPLKKARELDPDWPEATYYLARALPDGIEARDLARTAVAMRSTWPAAHVRLGELELATGSADAAKQAFETAIKQQPKIVGAHVGLAWAFLKLKKYDDAKRVALDAIKLAANNPSARLAHAEALAGLGSTDEAVETFKFAAGLDDKDPTGLVRAAEVLLAAKEPMKAEAHADGAVKKFPDDARAWAVKGDAAFANGDKKGAKEAYKKALAAPKGTIDKPAYQKKMDAIK